MLNAQDHRLIDLWTYTAAKHQHKEPIEPISVNNY